MVLGCFSGGLAFCGDILTAEGLGCFSGGLVFCRETLTAERGACV